MQMQCTRNRFSRTAHDLENIFNQVFGPAVQNSTKFTPSGDVVETEANYLITLELPGVRLEDIAVEFVDDVLKVSGEKKIACDDDAKACHCSERRGGEFERLFRFPTDVDSDKVEAHFENGLLKITLPKAAKVLPRKVEIKGGK